MTIYFDATGGETFDLYGPDGGEIASDVPFSGSWEHPPGYPEEVLDELYSLARDYYVANGWDEYLLRAMADVWFHQIEEGTPP